jgi:methyl-accepting chemotaxis protein
MSKRRVFANLPLAAKLFIAPGVVMFCLVVMSIMAYVGIAKQKDAIENMHSKRFAMYRVSADLLVELTRVHEGMFRVMAWSQVGYADERIEAAEGEQLARLKKVRATVATILQRDLLPEERAAYAGLDKPLADYEMWAQRVMDMANSDIATAAVYMGTAELKFTSLKDVLMRLAALEVQSSDEYFAQSLRTYRRTLFALLASITAAILIAVGTTYFITKQITHPIHRVVSELGAITDGRWDLTRRIPVESKDEISSMTTGINSFVEKLHTLIQKLSNSTRTLSVVSGDLTDISVSLTSTTRDTSQTTRGAAETTQSASENIRNISDAAQAMSAGVTSVSESIEQISTSLQNVVQHCKNETTMASEASLQAVGTRELMGRLGRSSREIGKIVDLIKTIAAQTDLLALNANIEAASAGIAGKGFAVVAREVKELALKTSKATNQIGSQIETIQDDATKASVAIEKITAIIGQINVISQTIVSSIEDLSQTMTNIAGSTGQSSSAAARIASNVAESARSLGEVDTNVGRVNQAAGKTADEVKRIASSSTALADLSADLGRIVDQFKV